MNNMDEISEEKINYANVFEYNEPLHSVAMDISAAFSHLMYENPDHSDTQEWKNKMIEWAEYERSIGNTFLATEEEAEREVDRLYAILEQVESLSKAYVKKFSG